MLKNNKYPYNYYKLPKNACKWKQFSVLSKQVFIKFHTMKMFQKMEVVMLKYIAKRIAIMLIMLLGMTFIVFASLYFAPGDAAELAAGPSATVAEVEQMRIYLGLDKQ